MKYSLLGFGVVVALVGSACSGGDDSTPTATVAATAEPTGTATVTTAPTATASPATPTSRPQIEVSGLFNEPRIAEPDAVVSLGPRESDFAPHDFGSVVLYDTVLGTEMTFGPGFAGLFSPDGRYMAWTEWEDRPSVEPTILRVIELATGEIAELGPIRGVFGFVDSVHVRVGSADSLRVQQLVNLETGEREVTDAVTNFGPPARSQAYELTGNPLRSGMTQFLVRDRVTGESVLAFEAQWAEFSGERELVVLIPAGEGAANIFLVDVDSGEATFVAASAAEPLTAPIVPVAANEDYVVWTPSFCNGAFYFDRGESSSVDRGPTTVYDRATGTTTALADSTLWIAGFTPDGRMIDGGFGGEALIDPATLSWDVVLSEGSGDVNWSPDYRFASRGESPGHGGTCPS